MNRGHAMCCAPQKGLAERSVHFNTEQAFECEN